MQNGSPKPLPCDPGRFPARKRAAWGLTEPTGWHTQPHLLTRSDRKRMMLQMSQSVRHDMGAKPRANGLNHVKARAGIRNAGTLIVLAHLAVTLGHGSGHTHLGIGTNLWQTVFIAIVILAGPLIAMILLWTRMQRAGVLLL